MVFLPFKAEAQSSASRWSIIWGTDAGLYRRDRNGRMEILWSGGKVNKILQISKAPVNTGSTAPGNSRTNANMPVLSWMILTDQGIWASGNLKDWEERNSGLPEKVIKEYEEGKKTFITSVQGIKDFEIDPGNPELMVCAVKDSVFLSRTGGKSWENLGMPNYRSNGIKATAVTTLDNENEIIVFCSHAIYGVYYISPGKAGARWIEVSDGFEKLETTNNPDEISDIAVTKDGIYASQSFRRRLYKLDWEKKNWNLVWSDGSEFGIVESLAFGRNRLRFVQDGGIFELSLPLKLNASENKPAQLPRNLSDLIKNIPGNTKPNCVLLLENSNQPNSEAISLSELWLTNNSPLPKGSRLALAADKDGIYLPVNHAMDSGSLRPYLEIIGERQLNMVVIDMKDDYGRLRFTPENQELTNFGRVFRPVDIDTLLKDMKERGIFTVARIVVFKDPEAAAKVGGKYAVWDGSDNKPWAGYYDTRLKKPPSGQTHEINPSLVTTILPTDDPDFEILRTWYDEKWVDPYSEEIWNYNASVAEELCRRGFDEIQFDYIRFPTDGLNLGDARYRWREAGMDMDSAILSFLRHVRSRVKAPISVDIYGANGWYRTGARTGQEVELFAPYVDVICPMYYPSHFEQDFLAHDPPELRPYRIYYQGTRRTFFIARGKVIVRPWAQAFYLNVSYDRKYYNADYVRLQAEGVRAAGNGGLTYWNNSGRYDDIPIPAEITARR